MAAISRSVGGVLHRIPSHQRMPSNTIIQTRNITTSKYPNFMPRHKYAAVSRLDKLHRQQKADNMKEKLDSRSKALLMQQHFESTGQHSPTQEEIMRSFSIVRTRTGNLPVYESSKAGGSKHITTIQKANGDLDAMRQELRTLLELPEFTVDRQGRKKETLSVNRLNQHLVIKGWRGAEIKQWAQQLGF